MTYLVSTYLGSSVRADVTAGMPNPIWYFYPIAQAAGQMNTADIGLGEVGFWPSFLVLNLNEDSCDARFKCLRIIFHNFLPLKYLSLCNAICSNVIPISCNVGISGYVGT